MIIRRILHAELSDVRALAREAKRRAVNAFRSNFFAEATLGAGCILIGENNGFIGQRERFGAGYIVDDPHADNWPDHARLLTIGRVTLAAWGGRSS